MSLIIESITVKTDRIQIRVRCESAGEHQKACKKSFYSDEQLAQALLSDFPSLENHACINECGPLFGSVITNTPLIHVFEHLIVELQSRAFPTKRFLGVTEYFDRECSCALVEVNYYDDFVALRSIKFSHNYVNKLLEKKLS